MSGRLCACAAAGIAARAATATAARRKAGVVRSPLLGLSAGFIAFVISNFAGMAHARDVKHSGQQMFRKTLNAKLIARRRGAAAALRASQGSRGIRQQRGGARLLP